MMITNRERIRGDDCAIYRIADETGACPVFHVYEAPDDDAVPACKAMGAAPAE